MINAYNAISSNLGKLSIQELYQLHANGKLHYDRERLQRLLIEWHDEKKNSYITFLLIGGNFKDLFQLAAIEPIVEQLKVSLNPSELNYGFIRENLDYFTKLLEAGKEYIVLDGQHRIDTIARYLENRLDLKPTKVIELPGNVYIRGKFNKLTEEVQDKIRNIPIGVTVYSTGDLRELAQIFITSNAMLPMSHHERRILNYNPINRWLTDFCLHDQNVKDMFANMQGMSGEYLLDAKGDTLVVAEMLMYLKNNFYEGYDPKALDDLLSSYPSGKYNVSDADLDLLKKIFRVMSDGCVGIDKKYLKKFTKSSYYNMFYTLSFLLQKNNHWGKKMGLDSQYDVVDKKEFVKYFLNAEFERMNAPGTFIKFTSKQSKKAKKQVHEWSFRKHNADQKHSKKESFANEGGSKYSFEDWARVRYLMEDLKSDLTDLLNRNIIKKVGNRTEVSRDEVLVANGIKLFDSDKYHVDEIVPVSKGGKRTIKNTQVVVARQNLMSSNRDKRSNG